MNLALPHTASAIDASGTLISSPDAVHMSLDTCFQNRSRSHLIGKSLGFFQKAGRSMCGLSSSVVNSKLFNFPPLQKRTGNILKAWGLLPRS